MLECSLLSNPDLGTGLNHNDRSQPEQSATSDYGSAGDLSAVSVETAGVAYHANADNAECADEADDDDDARGDNIVPKYGTSRTPRSLYFASKKKDHKGLGEQWASVTCPNITLDEQKLAWTELGGAKQRDWKNSFAPANRSGPHLGKPPARWLAIEGNSDDIFYALTAEGRMKIKRSYPVLDLGDNAGPALPEKRPHGVHGPKRSPATICAEAITISQATRLYSKRKVALLKAAAALADITHPGYENVVVLQMMTTLTWAGVCSKTRRRAYGFILRCRNPASDIGSYIKLSLY